jgi:iron complex outermembrane receptor protein
VDGSPLPSQQLLQTLHNHQMTQELRLNGTLLDNKLDYTLGGFYFKQNGTLEARVDLNYAGLDFIHGPDTTPSNSKAAFAHAEFHITDGLSLIGGLRYTKDYKNYTFFRRNPNGTVPSCPGVAPPAFNAPSSPPNCALNGLYNVSPPAPFKSDRTDWRLGVNYRWNEALMTYAQVSTGYKGGGINPRPFFAWQIRTFKPETMTTYEVGAKTDLADGRVRVNGALFFNKYKDIILTSSTCDLAPPLPSRPCALPSNVGAADVKGAELEANLRLGHGFTIDASASFLDFKYTSINDPATGVTLDMITPYTPERKYSLGAMWETDIGNMGSLLFRADWSFQSDVHSAAQNNAFTRVPPYGVANSRVTWRGAESKWEASFEVNNLTDKVYYTSNSDWSTNAGSTTFGIAMPRNFAVTVKRSF